MGIQTNYNIPQSHKDTIQRLERVRLELIAIESDAHAGDSRSVWFALKAVETALLDVRSHTEYLEG